MIYSFSRVGTFMNCPYSFYASYILNEDQWQNGWGVLGAYSHEMIELILKGEITPPESAQIWLDNLPEHSFPFMQNAYITKYIAESLDFFKGFRGINDDVLSVERHFLLDIDGISFQGFTDLECRSDSGVNKVVDWKFASESGFKGAKLKEKQRQLYFYAIAFKEEYGDYPDEMYFYLCLKNKPIKIAFNLKDLEEAKDWLKAGVAQIESAKEYPKKPNQFFCKNLCGVTSCELNGQHQKYKNNYETTQEDT